MNSGRYVLTQVLDRIHWQTLTRLVERYNIRTRHFGCRQQLTCMGFAQMTWRESLRDIEECLNAKGPAALYHLGLREPVARVTLAEANEQRDWRLWQDLATGLIKRARRLYAGEDLGLDLDETIYALDSTTIDLSLQLFPWAEFRSTKAGVKLHTQLDLRGPIPVQIEVRAARSHDVLWLDTLIFEPGAFYLLDRAYMDFTRVGKIELRVPQDRAGRFSTEVFERYQRSEKALVSALTEMYLQGVSTRKVKAISEELCGQEFSASTISALNKKLDGELARFARRRLEAEYPYLILDARYEKVREDGVVRSRAVQVAIGIDWEGRRQVLGVELANRESETSWKEFLLGLKERGLHGVQLVVSDDHAGLKRAIGQVLSEACWQRCYVHFLRNALDHLPRKANDDCLLELRWLYDRRSAEEARRDLAAWLGRWQAKYPKLCEWVEGNIEETWTFYRLPREHHKHLKSTNMLERINQELKRRTHIIRIFPNEASCLRLIRALAVEIHEDWIEAHRYLNMEALRDQRKADRQLTAMAA